ncbi:MAG: 6-bladed beta-propeller, partial [Tannerellaceae bacterium]|nr:6-bladed beta-propeller [Tannerellaceae bacterium]
MKKSLTILATILLVMAGCGESRPAGELITVDVTAGYPAKELILQDFMDVEYIPLETTDEFITQGLLQTVGKNIIIVTNYNSDGDIFIFDRRTGKALKKINRKGQGAEEYLSTRIFLDEDKSEMYVNDIDVKKILVYDMDGNF